MAADPFPELSTAHVADACARLGVPLRCGPAGLAPVVPGSRCAGRVLPARHSGSVDVLLEAIEGALPGDVLVVDDGDRHDAACIGDLIALEAARAGLAGVVLRGLHRDTAGLRRIGLPVFSLGALPSGPLRERTRTAAALTEARLGRHRATRDDLVLADDDGALLVSTADAERVAALAGIVRDTERAQAEAMRAGRSLRDQTEFARYLRERQERPITFRQHLRSLGAATPE